MSFTDIFGSNKPRCQHFHEDGKRCAADPQTNNKFCFMHDPEQKQKQTEARKKGGQARFQPYEPKMPASFKYKPINDRAQINGFLDQLGLYLQRGEMDAHIVRTYLYLASFKLSICKDEAREQREAQREAKRSAERQAQRAGKEPEFFDTDLDGRTLNGTRQELLQYWRNRAKELVAAQNPDATTRKAPQPEALPKVSPKPRSGEPGYPEDASEVASPTSTAPPPKRSPQLGPPAPASRGACRGSAQTEQQQQWMIQNDMNQLAECVAEQVRMTAAAKAKKYGWKKRGTKY